jgi:hypothetical protein
MISQVLNILAADDFYGVSDNIEIAKGKYEIIHTWKDAWYKLKRHYYYGR